MLSSSLIACLSASLGDKGLFSSVNIADVVRRVVFLQFLLCFWRTVHLFLHRETSEINVMLFSTHIICQIEKYLKPLSLMFLTLALYVNHFKAIYGGNK